MITEPTTVTAPFNNKPTLLEQLRGVRDELAELEAKSPEELDEIDLVGLDFLRARRDWLVARV